MNQDYLERQINQLARILGKILGDLLGFKKQGRVNEGIEITNQALKSELDFDIDELTTIKIDDLIHFLVKEKKLNNENIEKLAEILLLIADDASIDKKKTLYERCLIIYEHIEETETTFSFERQLVITKIKNDL